MKTAPQREWGAEVVKDYLLFGPEKWSFVFLERSQSWSEVTEFWIRPFFFLRSPKIVWKNRFNFGEDLFFWSSPDFDRKTASIWFKTDENLGQVRLLLFSPLKKARSPFAKSWLRARRV